MIAEVIRRLMSMRQAARIGPIDIDLSSPRNLPFPGAEAVVHRRIVKLAKRGDDLYLDGKKVILFLSDNQKRDRGVRGHALREALETRGGNVSAKVLDCLEARPELWPESWKKDEEGFPLYVCFWDDIFRETLLEPLVGALFVCCGHWYGGKVCVGRRWINGDRMKAIRRLPPQRTIR